MKLFVRKANFYLRIVSFFAMKLWVAANLRSFHFALSLELTLQERVSISVDVLSNLLITKSETEPGKGSLVVSVNSRARAPSSRFLCPLHPLQGHKLLVFSLQAFFALVETMRAVSHKILTVLAASCVISRADISRQTNAGCLSSQRCVVLTAFSGRLPAY